MQLGNRVRYLPRPSLCFPHKNSAPKARKAALAWPVQTERQPSSHRSAQRASGREVVPGSELHAHHTRAQTRSWLDLDSTIRSGQGKYWENPAPKEKHKDTGSVLLNKACKSRKCHFCFVPSKSCLHMQRRERQQRRRRQRYPAPSRLGSGRDNTARHATFAQDCWRAVPTRA